VWGLVLGIILGWSVGERRVSRRVS
jgi:hypothetical protein